MAMTFKDLIPDVTKSCCQSARFTQTMFWKGCLKLSYVILINSKNVWALYEQENEKHNSKLTYQKLKTMVKKCMYQKIRARNFEARNDRIESGVPVEARSNGELINVCREQGECYRWKTKGQRTKGNVFSSRHDENKRGKALQSSSLAPRKGHRLKAQGNLSALKESKESSINGKKKDSAQEETPAVSATMRTNVESQRTHPLQPQNRRQKAKGKIFEREVSEVGVRLGRNLEDRAKTALV